MGDVGSQRCLRAARPGAPWFKCLVASIADGSLYSGDRIHITVGDRSGGGPGSRAQMFRERGCEWRFFVDPFGTELAIDHRETPPSGAPAYWIRVTQEDGAQAWRSPVYLGGDWKRPIWSVGTLGRTLNVERLRLACGHRVPPRIWTF